MFEVSTVLKHTTISSLKLEAEIRWNFQNQKHLSRDVPKNSSPAKFCKSYRKKHEQGGPNFRKIAGSS